MGAPELAPKIEGKEAALAHYKAELDKLYPDVAREIKLKIDRATTEGKRQIMAGEPLSISVLINMQNTMIVNMYRMWALSPEVVSIKEKVFDEFGVESQEADEINHEILSKDSELRFYLIEQLDELERLMNNR